MIIKYTKGPDANKCLIDALTKQDLVRRNSKLAERLAAVSQVVSVRKGKLLIKQGASDHDLYFILNGSVRVILHGFWSLAVRQAHTHVGEMALIDTDQPRSASVEVIQDVVAAKVSEKDFAQIANDFPFLWREIASSLAERLRRRGDTLQPPNHKPCVFIGSASSRRALQVVRAMKRILRMNGIDAKAWTDTEVFKPGATAIESLLDMIRVADMAVMVATPEDETIRNVNNKRIANKVPTMRDNVLFEFGLFMGRLGTGRAFIVHPKRPIEHRISG